MIARRHAGSAVVWLLTFLAALLPGVVLMRVAAQRNDASWRARAGETASSVAAALGARISRVLVGAARVSGRDPSEVTLTEAELAESGIERLQWVRDDRVELELPAEGSSGGKIFCDQHAARGVETVEPSSFFVAYRLFPELQLALCAPMAEAVAAASAEPASRSPDWLVAWLDTAGWIEASGLRGLVEEGYDYRLEASRNARGIRAVLEESRPRRWDEALIVDVAVGGGEWVLSLLPRDPLRSWVALVELAPPIGIFAGALSLFVSSAVSRRKALQERLEDRRREIEALDVRLTEESALRRKFEREAERGALYDDLTGIPNRAVLVDRLDRKLQGVHAGDEKTAFLVLFDVDRLRLVNESMGRLVGDQLLKAIGRRIEESLRPEDVLARVGSDEFGALVYDKGSVEDIVRFVDRLQSRLEEPVALGGSEVFSSCSIGIAPVSDRYVSGEDVIRDATIAVSRAKSGGGRQQEVFDAEMHQRAVRLLEVETDLRRAVERGEMVAFYQPIVSLRTRAIIGFETLARWQHPIRGLVSPADFIPVAEQTGLIIDIDRWNLEEGVERLLSWQRKFPERNLTLSANLAALELDRPDIVPFVAALLERTGLHPRSLSLEVTESGVMTNPRSAAVILDGLKDLGVRLYLDDFGTGYSSLAYLHKFSFDTLKIDRAFVGRMTTDEKSRELVRTVMALARALSMDVVAEGIETEEQLAALRDLGCEKAQGFLFSKPVPASQIENELATGESWRAVTA